MLDSAMESNLVNISQSDEIEDHLITVSFVHAFLDSIAVGLS